MPPWPAWILSAAGVLIALLSLVRTFTTSSHARDRDTQLAIDHLQERCSLLEMKIGMFWRLVEERLSGMLKQPVHLEMDRLLDKLRDHTLTLPEARRLRHLLEQVYVEENAVPVPQRLIAVLVLGAVETLITHLEHA